MTTDGISRHPNISFRVDLGGALRSVDEGLFLSQSFGGDTPDAGFFIWDIPENILMPTALFLTFLASTRKKLSAVSPSKLILIASILMIGRNLPGRYATASSLV